MLSGIWDRRLLGHLGYLALLFVAILSCLAIFWIGTKSEYLIPWPTSTVSSSWPSHKIGRCTGIFGNLTFHYEEFLQRHKAYGRRYGYPLFVHRAQMVEGLWNKVAGVLETLLSGMTTRPADLDWLVWHDADTLIMNPLIPLQTFLPPRGQCDDVHFIYSVDWNGLNAGIFFLRASSWSVDFLAATLAYRTYQTSQLLFAEQSAMANLLEMKEFASASVQLPNASLNVYPAADLPWVYQPGQLLVHFAGNEHKLVMDEWIEKLSQNRSLYESQAYAVKLQGEMASFWEGLCGSRTDKSARDLDDVFQTDE